MNTNDVLEVAMVTALRADPALRAEVAKLLERAYIATEGGDASDASEASEASDAVNSKAIAVIDAITTEHVVFKLAKGWPVWVSPKGRNFVRMPITNTTRSVAKGDIADGVTTRSLLRKLSLEDKRFVAWVESKGLLDDVQKCIGTKFRPIANESTSKASGGNESTSKASEPTRAQKKAAAKAARKVKFVDLHMNSTPEAKLCTCTVGGHECVAVREYGERHLFS
jgi:hypothetical protein